MRVNEFLDIVGDYLQEDFSMNPVWPKDTLFGVVSQMYQQFCTLTGLIDKTEIRLINGTTGEMDVPKDFESGYFVQHEQKHVDIVEHDELDFVSGTWLGGTTGTPKAATVIGSGDSAVIRFVPRPSAVYGGGIIGGTVGLTLGVDGVYYSVTTNAGVLVTTAGASAPGATPKLVDSLGVFWLLSVNSSGVLVTSLSTGPASVVTLSDDTGTGIEWVVTVSTTGELITKPVDFTYGLETSALVDNLTFQDFASDGSGASAELGVIVDAYAQSSATTPDYTCRVNSSRGLILYAYTSDEAGMVWYKGILPELNNLYSEIKLSTGFMPVLLHGVLSIAFSLDCDGRDLQKAELLGQVFVAECEAIKRGFEYRWA